MAEPTPIASFHSPEELLDTAKELLAGKNPKLYRGAVLEALAALESYVQQTVFPALSARFSDTFSDWLKDKTKMDFDGRLSVLAPVATGIPVDKESALWQAYKRTRELRKGIVHGNRKIKLEEAQQVLTNTADWIAYFGRTLELEQALLDLKHYVESENSPAIRSRQESEKIVSDFFSRSKAAVVTENATFQVGQQIYEADAILSFGSRRVVVETKFVSQRRPLRGVVDAAVLQVDRLRRVMKIPQACVVVFVAASTEQIPSGVARHANGGIYSVVIRLRDH